MSDGSDTLYFLNPGTFEEIGSIRVKDIDLKGLVDREMDLGNVDVLNGIAYEADKDLLLVTGKLWPELFEIKIQPEA